MTSQTTSFAGGRATLKAHQDKADRLLLLELTAEEVAVEDEAPAPAAQIAIVVDRSGSMSGRKLDITKEAVARLIRSLRTEDRVAVIAYDDHVTLVSGMAAPSDELARKVERLVSGGSTDLYGGWVMGAKLVGPGGRVILLSDGLANVGRFTDAQSLERHAAISYSKYLVSTTTIGVGEDYDEALMAGMARAGGGSHYFAHNAEAIVRAFSQERFAIGAVSLSHVSLRYEGVTKELGHLWSGETKSVALRITELGGKAATLRFTGKQGRTETIELSMPADFGYSDEATLCVLKERAADLEQEAIRIRDPRSAEEARDSVRSLLLEFLNHPMADADQVRAIRDSLQQLISRLDYLVLNYDERQATIERKRMMQHSHNLRESHKAYSSFDEDAGLVMALSGIPAMAEPLSIDPDAAKLATPEQWRAWMAVPLGLSGRRLTVGLVDIRDGFLIAEIEKTLNVKVRTQSVAGFAEVQQLLEDAFASS